MLGSLAPLWRGIVWACVAYLFGLGGLVFLRPALIERFLDGHASSARLNLLEAALRLIAGAGFIGVSAEALFPALFFWFGAVLMASAIAMLFSYRLHQRYAGWATPLAKRLLPVLGFGAFGLGGIVVWGLI